MSDRFSFFEMHTSPSAQELRAVTQPKQEEKKEDSVDIVKILESARRRVGADPE